MARSLEDILALDDKMTASEEMPSASDSAVGFEGPEYEGPGVVGAFKKGLFKPLESWGGSVEPWTPDPMLGARLDASSDAERAALLPDDSLEPPEGFNPSPLPPEPVSIYESIPEPQTFAEKVSYDVGRNADFLLAGAVAAPALGAASTLSGAELVGLELGAPIAGMAAARAAEAYGAGPLAQGGVDLAVSAAAPWAAAGSGPRVVGRLVNAPEGAIDASQEVVEYLARRTGGAGALPPDVPPPGPTDAYEAAIEVQNDMLRGVEDGKKFIREGADRLAETHELFPDPNRRPSLAQSLSGEGTDNIASGTIVGNELRYAADDRAYMNAAGGRRVETLRWAQEAYENESPKFAGYTTTRVSAQSALDAAGQKAVDLWDQVPLDEMPSVDATKLVETLEDLRADIPGARYLPREADTIDFLVKNFDGQIPYAQLQSLASELSTTVRAGRAAGPLSEMAWRRKGRAAKLLGVVEEMLDEADPGDVASLRDARAATAYAKSLSTPIMNEIIDNADPVDVLNKIRNSDDIAEEVFALREVLGEDGLSGLRLAAWGEIFGDDLGSRSVHQMRSKMRNRNNRQLYEALFDPAQLKIIDRQITRQARASYGRAGTPGQPQGTGSAYQSNTEVVEALRELQSGQPLTARMIEGLRRGLREVGSATPQSLSIEKLASQDTELAEMLLRTPTPENLSAMASVWRQALARAHRRAPGALPTGAAAAAVTRRARDSTTHESAADEIGFIRDLRRDK